MNAGPAGAGARTKDGPVVATVASARMRGRAIPGKEVGRFLQPVLVDLIALVLNAKQAYWHVQGRHFTPIHEQLEVLVTEVGRFADFVAERLVTLDCAVDGRPTTVATTTSLPDFAPGFAPEDKVVSAVVDQIDAAVARARDALGPLATIDQVSQDVVIDILRSLERHRWMFAAQINS